MNKFTEEQIIAGARQMSDNSSEVCQVNREDNWQLYGQLFIDDFRSAADAAFSVSASTAFMPTVLTDERIMFEHTERESDLTRDGEGEDYANPCVQSAWEGWQARSKVAAQAGQVAVPEIGILVEALKDCSRHPRLAQRENIVSKALAKLAAPSPAKEST